LLEFWIEKTQEGRTREIDLEKMRNDWIEESNLINEALLRSRSEMSVRQKREEGRFRSSWRIMGLF